MLDPYIQENGVLKNKLGITSREKLREVEFELTAIRIKELCLLKPPKVFSFKELCNIHKYIFQDIFDFAGEMRRIDIMKKEKILLNRSVEYATVKDIEKQSGEIIENFNNANWQEVINHRTQSEKFSELVGSLWKVHPFREGNTRAVSIFCLKMAEKNRLMINNEFISDNAEYFRQCLVLNSINKPRSLQHFIYDSIVTQREKQYQQLKVVEKSPKKYIQNDNTMEY